MFLVVIRLWSVSHVRGFVTPADFVRSRFDSPGMALLVALLAVRAYRVGLRGLLAAVSSS